MTEKKATLIPGVVTGISFIKHGTIKVLVTKTKKIEKYNVSKKMMKNYAVECEKGADVSLGDKVFITECRKFSKTKHYILVSSQKSSFRFQQENIIG